MEAKPPDSVLSTLPEHPSSSFCGFLSKQAFMCACLPRTVGETSFRFLPHMGQRFSLTSAMASSRPPSSRGSSLRRITGLPSWGHSRLTIDLGTALFTFFRVSILLGSLKSSSSSSGSLSLRGGALDGGGVMVVEAIVAMETVGHDMASPPCPSLTPATCLELFSFN